MQTDPNLFLLGGLSMFVVVILAFILWAVLVTIRTRPREKDAPATYNDALDAWRRANDENTTLRRRIRELTIENRGLRGQVAAFRPEDEDFEEGVPLVEPRHRRADPENVETVRMNQPRRGGGKGYRVA